MRLSDQEIFDRALFGVRGQNYQRSVREVKIDMGFNNPCVYRGENGLKCAIGHCLPDKLAETLDNLPMSSINGLYEQADSRVALGARKEVQAILGFNQRFLSGLQSIHDGMPTGDQAQAYFEDRMKAFARLEGLAYTEPA